MAFTIGSIIMKKIAVLLLVFGLIVLTLPAQAQDRINYTSQPDEILIFLNNVAFVKDQITIPTGTDVAVTLPAQIYPDTLVLRENGERVNNYRLRSDTGSLVVTWEGAAAEGELREVTLDYLVSGISWRPKYDMWLTEEDVETVDLDFLAEISNSGLTLEGVTTTLAAGRVDTAQPLDQQTAITANQYIAGFEQPTGGELGTGAVEIQTLYEAGEVDSRVGDTLYLSLAQATLEARRVLLWNAQTDNRVSVIYKVCNETEAPFAEGIVRSYQDGVFLGSDFVELTPIGGEGSVTIGTLQDVRVNRNQTQTNIGNLFDRIQTNVELTVSSFSAEPVEIEIVDGYPADAENFVFSQEAERQIGNLLRWQVTIPPGETLTITYQYEQ
jgi:hypothetical protein